MTETIASAAFRQPSLPVTLGAGHIRHARQIGRGRHGCAGGSNPLDSGEEAIRADVRGAMAEIAVCIAARVPMREHVEVYEKRPGASPDLVVGGRKVSVKSKKHWLPDYKCHLVVPEWDVENDLYVLVKVNEDEGLAWIMGYITRTDLLLYEPEEWKWDRSRPGAKKPQKKRRYVPLGALTLFKGAR